MQRSHYVIAILIAFLLASPGCDSGKTVWVTGKLVKGGAAYVPPKDQHVSVTFVELVSGDKSGKTVPTGEMFFSDVDESTGSFAVPGPDGRGIPPGRYRIAVTQKLTREAFDATKPKIKKKGAPRPDREKDMLGGFRIEDSPIIRDVQSSVNLVIDLDKPTE